MLMRFKQCGVYCYQNIVNGKKYIGQSIDLVRRKSSFGLKDYVYSGKAFQNAINKYGKDKFQYSVLTHCKPEELNHFETFYIARLKTNDSRYGYNCTSGGDSCFIVSDETREKLKRNKFVKYYGDTPESLKEKITLFLTENNSVSYQDVADHFGITRLAASKICHDIGYTTDKALSNLYEKQRKPVVQCDRTNHDIILNVFRSLSEAERITGIRAIKHCVEGKQYSSGGYYWRYSDGEVFTGNYNTTYLCPTNDRRKLTNDVKQKLRETGLYKKENLYKKVFCYNGTGNLIKVYNSVSSVTVDGFDPCQVSHCCNPKQIDRTHKGYAFSYKELSQKQVLDLFVKHVKKPVVQLTLDGHFIKEWESATLAGKELGLGNTNISSCCQHKTNKHGNFKWFFKEEYDSLSQNGKVAITEPKPPNSKTVNLVDENGDIIKTYVSRRSAAKELNIKEGSVYLYVNKKKLIMGKYYLAS